jgi:hypothetical protein
MPGWPCRSPGPFEEITHDRTLSRHPAPALRLRSSELRLDLRSGLQGAAVFSRTGWQWRLPGGGRIRRPALGRMSSAERRGWLGLRTTGDPRRAVVRGRSLAGWIVLPARGTLPAVAFAEKTAGDRDRDRLSRDCWVVDRAIRPRMGRQRRLSRGFRSRTTLRRALDESGMLGVP